MKNAVKTGVGSLGPGHLIMGLKLQYLCRNVSEVEHWQAAANYPGNNAGSAVNLNEASLCLAGLFLVKNTLQK